MAKTVEEVGYGTYWMTWGLLLALTLVMLSLSYVSLPKKIVLLLLLAAMMAKASLIGGYFMHLRYEKPALALAVAAGILATGAALAILLVWDGLRVLRLSLG